MLNFGRRSEERKFREAGTGREDQRKYTANRKEGKYMKILLALAARFVEVDTCNERVTVLVLEAWEPTSVSDDKALEGEGRGMLVKELLAIEKVLIMKR